jgi:transposase
MEVGTMIQITPQMRVLVAVDPVDFRKGIDGLARVCRERLRADAFSGWLFVFRNRRETAVKILVYDGQGFWLCQKRLSSGRFRWWPTRAGDGAPSLESFQLQMLLAGANPTAAQGAPVWRRVGPPS